MAHRTSTLHLMSTTWDILLASVPLLLGWVLPDMVPASAALVGIPLLLVRYRIIHLERQLQARAA